MSRYARLNAEGQVECILEIDRRHLGKLRKNGKAAHLRRYVEDRAPEPGPDQVLEAGPLEVGEHEVHRTWVLRDKTEAERAAESAASAEAAEREEVRALACQLPDSAIPASTEERLTRLERIVAHLAKGLLK